MFEPKLGGLICVLAQLKDIPEKIGWAIVAHLMEFEYFMSDKKCVSVNFFFLLLLLLFLEKERNFMFFMPFGHRLSFHKKSSCVRRCKL